MPDLVLMMAQEQTERPVMQMLPPMLFMLGLVIIMVLWMMSMRSRAARRAAARHETPREQIERIKAGHRGRDVEQQLSAQFVSSAQEISARLDNKCERLEQLIAEADDRIAKLLAMRGYVSSEAASDHIEVEDATDAVVDDKSTSPAPPTSEAPRQPSDPLTRSIYQLADAGRGPVEIAQELEEQVGKVELILALRSR